jgi:hypothetical protein
MPMFNAKDKASVDFLLFKANQELEEAVSNLNIAQNSYDYADIDRIRISAQTCGAAAATVEQLNELASRNKIEIHDEHGNIVLDAQSVIDAYHELISNIHYTFKDLVIKYNSIRAEIDERSQELKTAKTRYKAAVKKVETLQFASRSIFGKEMSQTSKVVELTPLTIGMSAGNRDKAVSALLSFLKENKDELPAYLMEYIDTWLTEQKEAGALNAAT